MAWIEIHQSLRDHRKVLVLADELDLAEPHIVGHLVFLWSWSLDNAPDGVLPNSDRMIARASGWTGVAADWVNALVTAGLLIREGDALTIHDWSAYTGKLIGQREANRDRQRRHRDRGRDGHDQDDEPIEPRHDDKRVTSPSRNGATNQPTVPTVPTVPTKPTNPPPLPPVVPVTAAHDEPLAVSAVLLPMIQDVMPKVSADFTAIDRQLSATWLRKTLARAEWECDGGAGELAPQDLRTALTTAHDAIGAALRTATPEYPIRVPTAFAADKLVEAITSRLNDVRDERGRPPTPITASKPISSRPMPAGVLRAAEAIERERHEQHSTSRVDNDRQRPVVRAADGRGVRDPGPRPDAGPCLVPGRPAPVRGSPAEQRPRAPDRDPVHDALHRGLSGSDGPAGRAGRPRA